MLDFLNLLLAPNITTEKKKQDLKEKHGMVFGTQEEKEMNTMCNLGQMIAEKSEARGRAEGEARGRAEVKKLSQLITYLAKDQRMEDLVRVGTDEALRNSLYREYKIIV